MSVSAKILLDSITDGGSRLVTWEWTYPRMIHSEIMTHRALSKNSASSRAIPAAKLRRRVLDEPAVPGHWGANQRGMQASSEVADADAARAWWMRGRDLMAAHHEEGERLGLHKQVVNRVIEPWMLITIIVSGTDWANFFSLRTHEAAEPNFRALARLAWDQFHEHMPAYREPGDWHLPMIDMVGGDHDAVKALCWGGALDGTPVLDVLKKVSVGRCARVSYLTHDGRRDMLEDVGLHDTLASTATSGDPMHASPFEHVAQAVGRRERCGNFEGWRQYRKFFDSENGPDTTNRCYTCGCWHARHVVGCPEATS